MPIEWPLVGRREELVFIGEALDGPQERGVVLAGAPGVGNTRLAHEALRLAESKGLSVAWASGTQAAASLPFGALPHLLPLEPLSAVPVPLLNLLGMAADALVERAWVRSPGRWFSRLAGPRAASDRSRRHGSRPVIPTGRLKSEGSEGRPSVPGPRKAEG